MKKTSNLHKNIIPNARKHLFTTKVTSNHMYGKSVLFSCRVVRLCSIRNKSSTNHSTKTLLGVLAEMPKANTSRILDAQRQRQNISKKSEKYAPSTVYLQVLGSGARGAPNTLYVFTDQKRYLFNCGESTQRLAHEHKVKLSRLEHIFITAKSWSNIGGLPGLSLTLQDVGVPKLTLHGPEGLDELYQATKRFVIMKDMNVTMAECTPTVDFEDNVMSVKYVILSPQENLYKDLKPAAKKPKLDTTKEAKDLEKFIHDDTDYYRPNAKSQIKRPKEPVKSRLSPERDGGKTKKDQGHDKKKCTVAYICTLKKRLGTLDLAKCVEFGVPPGPMLGQLKAGFDVVLSNGRLVLSKDVKTPDDPGPVFIVLEVPELSYLKETEFSAHFAKSNPPERIPALVVHYTPPHVFCDPKYRQFMAMFGRDTKHLVLNSQNSCLGSEAVHRTQHKLHLLDPDIFPLLRDVSVPAVWNTSPLLTECPAKIKGLEELKNKIALAQFQNIITMEGSCKGDSEVKPEAEEEKYDVYEGRTLTVFHLRPKKEIDRSAEPKLHIQDYIQETMDIDGFAGSLDTFRKQVESIRYLQSDATEFPKVIFLGTGSCIPSKTRNTSGMVLQINENKSMLLDCGEGTFGQLVRFFGPKRVNSFLRTLRAIYISHLHADHHIGLIGVLQARRQAFKDNPSPDNEMPFEPLYLLAPGQIMSWLNMYDLQFEKIRNCFTLIPNQSLLHTEHTEAEMTPAALASIGLERVRTCLVAHCPNAFGVALDLARHRVTYSGDTLPCDELAKIGDKSTLLIHEATMEDELAEEARTKMHSTTSQAIEQGRAMKAKYTVLTHFSQRYARLPRLNAHILNDNRSVGIAFDNMQITMSDLKLLPHMYAPLQLMFAEHCVELELKAAHRARLRQRRDSSPSLGAVSQRERARGRNRDRNRSKSSTKCRGVESAPKANITDSDTSRNPSRCRLVESMPKPTCNYRESNASRLRQELKGMTVGGVVKRPRCTSALAPKAHSVPSSLHSDSGGQLSMMSPGDLDSADFDVTNAARTLSDTAKPSTRRKTSRFITLPKTNSSSALHVDSTKKKFNCTKRQPSTERIVVMSHLSKSRAASRTIVAAPPEEPPAAKPQTPPPVKNLNEGEGNAYGKPLVTNLNKRIKIMRYTPTPILFNEKDVSNVKRSSLPSPAKPIKPILISDKDSLKAKSATKSPVKPIKFEANHKETVQSSSLNKAPEMRPKLTLRPQPISRTGSPKKPGAENITIKDNRPISAKLQSPERRISARQIGKEARKPFEPLRDIVTERLKQPLCKGKLSPPQFGRPHPGLYNNRSYKPQLEDIKSSFLLLNRQSRETNANITEVESGLHMPAQKPPRLNEAQRRRQLMEVKKKYQSRGFYIDSKYDKIEGLNWISWK